MNAIIRILSALRILPLLAELVRRAGALESPRDTVLAHIRPDELELLKANGGSGRVLSTGLPSFDDDDDGDDDDDDDSSSSGDASSATSADAADSGFSDDDSGDDDDGDDDDDDNADADGNYGDGVGYGGLSDGRSGGMDDNADADGNYGDGLGYGGLSDGKSTDAWGWSYTAADENNSANYGYGSLADQVHDSDFATSADIAAITAEQGKADRTGIEDNYDVNTPDETNFSSGSLGVQGAGLEGNLGVQADDAIASAQADNDFNWGVDDANSAAYSAVHGGTEAHDTSFLGSLAQLSKENPWVASMLGLGLTFINPTIGAVYTAARGALDGKTGSWLGTLGGLVGGKAGQVAGSVIGNTIDGNAKGAIASGITGALGLTGNSLGTALAGTADKGSIESAAFGALGSWAQGQAANAVASGLTSGLSGPSANTGTATSLSGTADNSDNASSDSASSTISGNSPAVVNLTPTTTSRTASSTPSTSSSGFSVGGLKWLNDGDDSNDATGLKKLIAQSKQQRTQALQDYTEGIA